MIIDIVTLFSCLLLFCFIFLGIGKYGILESYSGYSTKWSEVNFPLNIWSLVTFIAAAMIIPIMLILSSENILQCVAFFTPAYLMFVSFTPNWENNKFDHIIHTTAALLCTIMALIYIIFVAKLWWVLLIGIGVSLIGGLLSKTLIKSIVFWLEILMFISIYITILIL